MLLLATYAAKRLCYVSLIARCGHNEVKTNLLPKKDC